MAEESDLEAKVIKLKKYLDEAADTDGWDYIKKEAPKAPSEYMKKFKGGKEVKEENLDEELNKRAETYLQGVGIKAKQGSEFYGHMVKNWLRSMGQSGMQMMGDLEEAIKQGDETTALYVMQKAYQAGVTGGKDQQALGKLEHAPQTIKLKTYQKIAEDLGGKDADYVKIIQDVQGSYGQLKRQKATQKQYRKAA